MLQERLKVQRMCQTKIALTDKNLTITVTASYNLSLGLFFFNGMWSAVMVSKNGYTKIRNSKMQTLI